MNKLHEKNKLIIDSVRILILISVFHEKKSFKLTIDKIMLYDYFMKFPNVMIENNETKMNFDEFYAFYEWKPNYIEYIKIIKFLISKKLINHQAYIKDKKLIVTDIGEKILVDLEYMNTREFLKNAEFIRSEVSCNTDKLVEEFILKKYKGK